MREEWRIRLGGIGGGGGSVVGHVSEMVHVRHSVLSVLYYSRSRGLCNSSSACARGRAHAYANASTHFAAHVKESGHFSELGKRGEIERKGKEKEDGVVYCEIATIARDWCTV